MRRLLENGANSSFVNRFLDEDVPVDELVTDVLSVVRGYEDVTHPSIPLPQALYQQHGEARSNSIGPDLDDERDLASILAAVIEPGHTPALSDTGEDLIVLSPADVNLQAGKWRPASAASIEAAFVAAEAAQWSWDHAGGNARAQVLDHVADLMEQHLPELVALLAIEAGRTLDDGVAEVREAVDFARYYAQEARSHFTKPLVLPGPTGEVNRLSLHGRGVFACISPWNFPLAIFTGQISAALAAGNSVLAKPAEQTPLIAARVVELFTAAGLPEGLLHLLPGSGATVGHKLVSDPRIAGVAFTGSIQTAWTINQALAARVGPIVPLIAETGGQNAMIVDSTALPEQVVDDVVASAFKSAGQRCSALRVLYLQEDIADPVITMLKGAMAELKIGLPWRADVDIGPIIDVTALKRLQVHAEKFASRTLAVCDLPKGLTGHFFAPRMLTLHSIAELEGEVFGPVLHVIRFSAEQIETVIDQINATGYGLTLGVHTRIDRFAKHLFERVRVGNVYVNRNMVGAVVGVNPFGGEGLSGTGPKAGGPRYLLRFATERTWTDNRVAQGGNTDLFRLNR